MSKPEYWTIHLHTNRENKTVYKMREGRFEKNIILPPLSSVGDHRYICTFLKTKNKGNSP